MEKKTKSTTKKQTKKVVKKPSTKKETKINSKKKKGFTLIELLAVIIILGILMIIAIPSVTRYINDSRKSAYIDTAKEIISGTRNLVNEGKLGMYDTNTTYYIPTSCIKTENASKSPYGDFTKAYVGVIYNGTGYKYYWISVDDAGQGIRNITPLDKLDIDNIESDLKDSDIEGIVTTTGIGNRSEIKILDCSTNSWDRQYHLDNTSNNVSEDGGGSNSGGSGGGSSSNAVVYPSGKTKDTVVTGDIVTINTEEFYVVKHDGNDLVLLAHYNLNVGNNKYPDAQEGIQNENVFGYKSGKTTYGNIAFSSTDYWSEKVGTDYPGNYCGSGPRSDGLVCVYVYYDKNKNFDSTNNIYEYVNAYKEYLEKNLKDTIKDARLLTVEEAFELGCQSGSWIPSCTNAPSWLYETSYWLGNAGINSYIWRIDSTNYIYPGDVIEDMFGVRPVIVI